jgi:hypothetical protein
MMTNARFRLDTLKPSKRSLASLAAIPLATTAHGAITLVDVTLGITDSLHFDFDGGTFATTSQAGYTDVSLFFNYGVTYGESEKPVAANGGAWVWKVEQSGGFVHLFDIGATTTDSSTDNIAYLEHKNDGPGEGGFTNKAIAFTDGSNAAYALMSYDDIANQMTIHHFDTAAGQTTIQVEAIPEPATSAALMALLAGGATVFQRSRKRANI